MGGFNLTYGINNETGTKVEEMVNNLRSGDSTYFEPLFLCFQPLIRKLRLAYQVRTMEEDDYYQEARIVLHHAIHHYEKDKGLSFGSYYKLLLQNRIFTLIRRETAAKRVINRHTISYDYLEENQHTSASMYLNEKLYHHSPEQIIQVREATHAELSKLSKFEREVFRYYLEGELDNRMIAIKMGRTLVQVQQAYNRIMKKLKRQLK